MSCAINKKTAVLYSTMSDSQLVEFGMNIYAGLEGQELVRELSYRLHESKKELFHATGKIRSIESCHNCKKK